MDAITKPRRAKTAPDRRAKLRAEIEALTEQAAAAARMLKLLGNEHRLLILCFLITQGEMKVGDLVEAVNLSQSALSQHLALLREEDSSRSAVNRRPCIIACPIRVPRAF